MPSLVSKPITDKEGHQWRIITDGVHISWQKELGGNNKHPITQQRFSTWPGLIPAEILSKSRSISVYDLEPA